MQVGLFLRTMALKWQDFYMKTNEIAFLLQRLGMHCVGDETIAIYGKCLASFVAIDSLLAGKISDY